MRHWNATGSNVVSDDGIIIEVPVLNPATGAKQLSCNDAYSIAMLFTLVLNRREKINANTALYKCALCGTINPEK
jgi:hypothetical protein